MAPATPMFIADAALGRLATWLRLLGYDTIYVRRASVDELIRRARDEARILLTRNTRVMRRRDVPAHVFVESDDFRAQVRQVLRHCGLQAPPAFLVRCSRCNTPLEHLDHSAACKTVPQYVCETQASFARCPECARIYWPATHVDRMQRELEKMGVLFSGGGRLAGPRA